MPLGPSLAGRAGLYILLLHFLSFFFFGPAGAANPIPTVVSPTELIKYPQTFYPCYPLFTGGEMSQILAQISTPIVFGPPYFFKLRCFIGKQKQTCQGRMIGLPPHQTRGQWVPPTPRTVGAMGTQKGKSGKFLYILHSSGPRRVQFHQCYTTCWGRSCCKKATVLYLLIRPLHFTGGGAKISST